MANLNGKNGEWLSVRQFALATSKSRSQIYLDIRLGKIPADFVRTAEFKFEETVIKRKQIFFEN
jgi:hypothetical protein